MAMKNVEILNIIVNHMTTEVPMNMIGRIELIQ